MEWTGSREATGEELETVLTENFLAMLSHSWKGILLKKKKNGRAQAKALGNPVSKESKRIAEDWQASQMRHGSNAISNTRHIF